MWPRKFAARSCTSKRGDDDRIADICEAIDRIMTYADGLSFEAFLADEKTQDAVVRNLEIIGEAVKHLSSAARRSYPNVDWKAIAGMRDKLIHDYFGVNLDILWDAVTHKLPELRKALASS